MEDPLGLLTHKFQRTRRPQRLTSRASLRRWRGGETPPRGEPEADPIGGVRLSVIKQKEEKNLHFYRALCPKK